MGHWNTRRLKLFLGALQRMKLIAHRGNTNGPKPLEENSPDYIDLAISKGFDVEVDIRYDTFDKNFYLGHDEAQYIVTSYWLAERMQNLWVHCKNLDALYEFSNNRGGYNYFWHQTDNFTLTNNNYIWTYPGLPYTPRSIIVMPESVMGDNKFEQIVDFKVYNCYAICSDYVGLLE